MLTPRPGPGPRGFSLVELMITLGMTALILVAATPPLTTWVANARVRGVAEQLAADLREALTEALRRNRQTAFALTEGAPALDARAAEDGDAWFAQALPLLAGEAADDGQFVLAAAVARQHRIGVTGPAVVCFNTIGRPVSRATPLGEACAAPLSLADPIEYRLSASGSDRPLRVRISLGGQIRLCDPARALADGEADGC